MTDLEDLSVAVEKVRQWLGGRRPSLALVLGSGLADLVRRLENPRQISYRELPGFPEPTVPGHAGSLHCGELAGENVLVFQGRFHVYEGYSAWQVTAPVRLAAAVGCRKLLLTNAAGGVAAGMQEGDFMLVTDHLNLTGQNPLRGRSEAGFIDLSMLYTRHFFPQLHQQAERSGIRLHAGVLAWMLGPSYETPAEIGALKLLGASAVSMSTVPEAIVARSLNFDTVVLSFISNLAAGVGTEKLDHVAVLNSGRQAAGKLATLIELLFPLWH